MRYVSLEGGYCTAEARISERTTYQSLRHRLGEKIQMIIAPSLVAVFRLAGIKDLLLICFIAGFCCSIQDVQATPLIERNYEYMWQVTPNRTTGDVFDEPGLFVYPCLWMINGNFNEGDNLEWQYDYLESRYTFLDKALYKFSGGSYLVGSIGYPRQYGPRYISSHIPGVKETEGFQDKYVFFGDSGKNQARQISPMEITHNKKQDIYYRDIIGMNMNTVPEPSAFILFSIAAIAVFRKTRS